MTDPDFPPELRTFIQGTIPNIEAAEVLLLFARERDAALGIEAIVDGLKPTVLEAVQVRRYLSLFQERRLIAETGDGTYRYSPESEALERVVRGLAKAYNERPVTLVRLIYTLRDENIRSFADAFRLKKE
jgi:hypothetical protein